MVLNLAEWHETFSKSMLALKPTELHFEFYHPMTGESAHLTLKTAEESEKFLANSLPEGNLRFYKIKHGVMVCPIGTKMITNGLVA